MKVLVLDDREETLEVIYERLNEVGYEVSRCYDIYEADDIWEKYKFDVIITDLSLSPEGLTPKEKKETCGSSLTGWIWLVYHICRENNFDILKRTIIFSEYIDLAKKNVQSKNIYCDHFRSVKKVPKSGNVNFTNSLDEVLEILKRWK